LEAGHQVFECEGITFDVSVGTQCHTETCGLIIDIHGFGADADAADAHTNMRQLGTAAGYVVVQPNSPLEAWDHEADDDRVWAFIELIVENWNLDLNRIHIGGHSLGADMTWRFICDHAEHIASAAPASTGLVEYINEPREMGCDFAPGQIPAHEVDLLLVHGSADSMVPLEAALGQRDAVIAIWAMEEAEPVASGSDYAWTRWISPTGTVLEFVQHDWSSGFLGGHCLPGTAGPAGCGPDTAVHYGESALQFYIEHPRND
jgi:poly(3-hydroxybutyrate) depolymerase